MARLFVLMGAPGSGKSTIAPTLAGRVVTTDALRGLGADQVSAVYGRVYHDARQALVAGEDVVLDTPAVWPSARRKALALARSVDAEAILVVLFASLGVCIQRQSGRQDPVPRSRVEELWYAARSQVGRVTSEGWSAIRYIDGGG